MSILQASRTKSRERLEDRNAPIVVIEEPESFLHPLAQAEFGKVLQSLSDELKIQIIVSTHSPYMLNQVHPPSNILFKRKNIRRKALNTEIIKVEGDSWMAPYAEHLGIIPPEFESWRNVFLAPTSNVVLVEGETDKEYIDFMRNNFAADFGLPENVEIVSYGGKDALTNMVMVKFILSKINKFFVTFDLDAAEEVTKSLTRIGLIETEQFCAVGLPKSGHQAIEGLLPERVLKAVHSRETEAIMTLASATGKDRNSARNFLKKCMLEEFKRNTDYSELELKPLFQLGKVISRPFK